MDTQSREHLDAATVEDYAEKMREGETFPAITAFHDGTTFWIADGFHRHAAAVMAAIEEIDVAVQTGGLRDAILFAVGANATHGLRRTNADKRRSVQRLLEDEEWAAWSDREIARRCSVDHKFVGKLRPDLVTGDIPSDAASRTFTTRHGTVAKMDTARIGRAPTPAPAGSMTEPALPSALDFRWHGR